MKRLNILAVAYACAPSQGSEAGVGWGWVNAIAQDHDVTVITADYNAAVIESYFRTHRSAIDNAPRFVYVHNRPWHYKPQGLWLRIEDSIAKPLMNLAYQNWLRHAFTLAREELSRQPFDLVHLITYVGWRFPGNFYRLGIPFVWGPIGGMINTPWHLLPIMGARGALYYGGRNIINSLQLRLLPGPRHALRAARTGLIAATSEIQAALLQRFHAQSRVICEVGPPQTTTLCIAERCYAEPLTICWSGQHLPGKALPLLLRAATRLPVHVRYQIEILGEGPCTDTWKALATRLKVEAHCRWHGWLPLTRSLETMRTSHVFVITSLKDLTSTVAVEALSLGLPIICLNHCGFADLVTEHCGIKVPLGSLRSITSQMADAISLLYSNEPLRQRLAAGAIRRSQEYAWKAKMEIVNEIYCSVLGSGSSSAHLPLASALHGARAGEVSQQLPTLRSSEHLR